MQLYCVYFEGIAFTLTIYDIEYLYNYSNTNPANNALQEENLYAVYAIK